MSAFSGASQFRMSLETMDTTSSQPSSLTKLCFHKFEIIRNNLTCENNYYQGLNQDIKFGKKLATNLQL